jgi:integrase/recombinase XerC
MSKFRGHPLFDTKEFLEVQIDFEEHRCLHAFFERLALPTEDLLRDFQLSLRFVSDYSDTPGTFNRFRGEVQRFLNYLWVTTKRTLVQVDQEVVTSYLVTLNNPPDGWVSRGIYPAFRGKNGLREPNPKWRPFLNRSKDKNAAYYATQASIDSSRTVLQCFFSFLVRREHLAKNPMPDLRRKDKRAKPKKSTEEERAFRRLTDWQWSYLLDTLIQAADENSDFERELFVVVTMKTLFLRVGELAPRPTDVNEDRVPVFGDFRLKTLQGEQYWSYAVFGKGDKARSVTLPSGYLPFLKRWREHLGLIPSLPLLTDNHPILPSNRGGRALGKRQVQRAYESAIELAAERMVSENLKEEAESLRAIKTETHYLRHTGASQAIDGGIDIRHISEELGHASAAFTEAVYVNSDQARRRLASRDRSI